jgi:hypothetical protein
MLITSYEWEVVATDRTLKQALFDYAQASEVPIGDPGQDEPAYRDDPDLTIGYADGHGLLSYPYSSKATSSFTRLTPIQFLEMCDAYYHQLNSQRA